MFQPEVPPQVHRQASWWMGYVAWKVLFTALKAPFKT